MCYKYSSAKKWIITVCLAVAFCVAVLIVFSDKFRHCFNFDSDVEAVEAEPKKVYARNPQAVRQTAQEFYPKCSKGFHSKTVTYPVRLCLVNGEGEEAKCFEPGEGMFLLVQTYICVPDEPTGR